MMPWRHEEILQIEVQFSRIARFEVHSTPNAFWRCVASLDAASGCDLRSFAQRMLTMQRTAGPAPQCNHLGAVQMQFSTHLFNVDVPSAPMTSARVICGKSA